MCHDKSTTLIACAVLTICVLVSCATSNPQDSQRLVNNNNKNDTLNVNNNTKIIMEGGGAVDSTPATSAANINKAMGREHIIENVPSSSTSTTAKTPQSLNEDAVPSTASNETLPTVENKNESKKHDDNSLVVPRKGVKYFETNASDSSSLSSSSSTSTTTTTTTTTTTKPTTTAIKVLKKKPTITEGSDDEPFAPSNFDPAKPNIKSPNLSSSDLHMSFMEHNNIVGADVVKTKPDFVVAIVLVILAVPLVAILISVLYKRGSEWWQHRHYRRMDFLIDGMYNN